MVLFLGIAENHSAKGALSLLDVSSGASSGGGEIQKSEI